MYTGEQQMIRDQSFQPALIYSPLPVTPERSVPQGGGQKKSWGEIRSDAHNPLPYSSVIPLAQRQERPTVSSRFFLQKHFLN